MTRLTVRTCTTDPVSDLTPMLCVLSLLQHPGRTLGLSRIQDDGEAGSVLERSHEVVAVRQEELAVHGHTPGQQHAQVGQKSLRGVGQRVAHRVAGPHAPLPQHGRVPGGQPKEVRTRQHAAPPCGIDEDEGGRVWVGGGPVLQLGGHSAELEVHGSNFPVSVGRKRMVNPMLFTVHHSACVGVVWGVVMALCGVL